MSRFPNEFVWGVATSAHQIEGGWTDGRVESIWDRFPGLAGGDGRIACGHYHRVDEDIALMAELGVDAYRFSVAWPRIVPAVGEVNQPGLDFYKRLCDALLEHGITPYVTLYHWDLPVWIQERGGWLDRSTVDLFVEYAATVVDALAGRVRHWITHNEPWVASMLGHETGEFAPGIIGHGLAAAHHILLSHGTAVREIRRRDTESEVGIAIDCRPASPADATDAAVEACRHFDGFRNRWFFDPVFGKGYPDDMVTDYRRAGRWPDGLVHPGDLEIIGTSVDFLGVNYYTSLRIAPGSEESEATDVAPSNDPPEGYTEMGWPITPGALTAFLGRLHAEYRPKAIMITENGASYSASPRDTARVRYLQSHTAAVADAIAAGIPVTGYFLWSFLDNLEWTQGFGQRFGIVGVDFETLDRTPKASFDWYRAHIATSRTKGG